MNNLQTRPGQSVFAYGLIGLGLLFLGSMVFGYGMGDLWPFFIIVPGVVLFMSAQRHNDAAGLAVPGAIVTGTGMILLYQNMTGHWESWAYAWALYPVFTGMGLVMMGQDAQNESMINSGKGSIRWGLIAFMIGWAFFEGMIFNSGGLRGILLPVVLIAGGVIMLYGRPAQKRKQSLNGKVKYADVYSETGDSLQARIDAALAEDDENTIY